MINTPDTSPEAVERLAQELLAAAVRRKMIEEHERKAT